MEQSTQKTYRRIDAYAHIGSPRFGDAGVAQNYMERWEIDKSVFVLGPGIPDISALAEIMALAGDKVRVCGIPFGETEKQRIELSEIQIALGISGMRLMPGEFENNPSIINRLGEEGRWLYIIDPFTKASVNSSILQWLDTYPDGKIVSPHFIRPCRLEDLSESMKLAKELVAHERFFAIFSRHGGVGSREPYPHKDIKPWVEQVLDLAGWNHIMFGSEFPVMYWRDEEIDTCLSWLPNLFPEMTEEHCHLYFHGNAEKQLFSTPAPSLTEVELPDWVEPQIPIGNTVPLFSQLPIELPMHVYEKFLLDFFTRYDQGDQGSFRDYICDRLIACADTLDKG